MTEKREPAASETRMSAAEDAAWQEWCERQVAKFESPSKAEVPRRAEAQLSAGSTSLDAEYF